jgi:hypothetical protein
MIGAAASVIRGISGGVITGGKMLGMPKVAGLLVS